MSTKTFMLVVCLTYTVLLATALPAQYPSNENNSFLRRLRARDSVYCQYEGLACICNANNQPTTCGVGYYNPRWNI